MLSMNLRCVFMLMTLVPGIMGAQNLISVEFKVFPQPYTVMSNGQILQPYSWNGTRKVFRLPLGIQTLTLTAPGAVPLRISPLVAPGLQIQEKLEPRNSPLIKTAQVLTGKGPKSLLFTPDSKKILVPLVDDTGIDVISLNTLQLEPRLSTGATGVLKGFSEAAYLPSKNEIWISQFTTGQIHIFSSQSLDYLASVNAGSRGNEVVVFTPSGSKALVSNGETKQLSIIDTTTRILEKSLNLSGIPRGIAITGDSLQAYVAIFEGASVEKIDLGTFKSQGLLSYGPTGAMRHALALENRLFFSDMLRGGLVSAQAPTGRFLKFLYLGANLTTLVADPKGKYLFAVSRGMNNPADFTLPGPEFGKIFMVNTEDLTVSASVWGKNQPTGLAVSPDGKWMAFSNFLDNQVEIYRIR